LERDLLRSNNDHNHPNTSRWWLWNEFILEWNFLRRHHHYHHYHPNTSRWWLWNEFILEWNFLRCHYQYDQHDGHNHANGDN
jgi:hypothetical protein